MIASSIRSFLRFLLLHRLIDRDLAPAVPSFANWRLASLPETVSGEDLERLVRAIDTTSPIGLRDRAIVLCMVDLGMRASDVAGLELDGLDLAGRVLRLRRQKQREATAVPMSSTTGRRHQRLLAARASAMSVVGPVRGASCPTREGFDVPSASRGL